MRARVGAKSVWGAHYDREGRATSAPSPVTTNKMRGPLSKQPQKVGEHMNGIIDHVYFNGGLELLRHAWGPVVHATPAEAQSGLIPTLDMPSDHAPVIVDLEDTPERPRAEAPGEVAVTFVIEREGKPTSIQPELGRAPAELGPCLVKVVEGLVFDDHDGEPMPVSYPLVYQVDTKGARILPYPIVFTKPHAVRLPLLELPEDISPGATRLLELLLTSELEKPGDVSEEEQK